MTRRTPLAMTDHLGYSGKDSKIPTPYAQPRLSDEMPLSPDGPGIQNTISYYFMPIPKMAIISLFFALPQNPPAPECLGADRRQGVDSSKFDECAFEDSPAELSQRKPLGYSGSS